MKGQCRGTQKVWKGTGLKVSGSFEVQSGMLEACWNWQVSPLLHSEAEGDDGEVFPGSPFTVCD